MADMRLKVPPVAVFIVAVLLLGAGAWLLPQLSIAFPGQTILAALLVVAGAILGAQGVLLFRRARTTVNPMTPEAATKLVTDGVYRITRNPMYLGLLSLLLAVAVYLGTLTALVVLPAFVWYMSAFQIRPEEERLIEIFGDDYRDYRGKVRRWI
ncbi:methyltransferase family protein [Roseibium salinum]|uniref:Isoprenylcysteine carboxylmethyltransferase family protein n=1 Tax=Roseibium salinum TaxID=1604349 RepID=A0ABT3R2V0_9HYPH|nr:isoprenylcysteine carboxylmethyltransferase family protein [Roseibium sp. DSM 29163]MCX2723413.1 isoprenylcysteine carboxylmethyltransferase family protein [Roseibium sp. DSM 29163]MDN3718698.1 isoprenylcysteine carboxylmethyltransferase family protein [Roseibium salinum]